MERAEYWQEIASLATEAVSLAQKGEFGTDDEAREGLQQWIHETLDGHHSVIYTSEAMDVLRHSENDGAMVENFGSDGVVKDGALNWSAMAYCAMEQDLIERLFAEDDFDVNDPNPKD